MAQPKKSKRCRIQLPRCESVWGLVVENATYSKLVLAALGEPSLARAKRFTGSDAATFFGTINPPIGSLVLENAGMQGHRHMSRVPLSDIRSFGDQFSGLSFVDSAGKSYTGQELERVFGICPARDAMQAFNSRSVCFCLAGRGFTDDNDADVAGPGPGPGSGAAAVVRPPQLEPQPARLSAGEGEPSSGSGGDSLIKGLLANVLLAVEALKGPTPDVSHPNIERLQDSLSKLEASLGVRSGTVTRVRYDEDAGLERRIGGYNYEPTFLLDAVLMSDNLKEPSLLKDTVLKSFQLVAQPALFQHFGKELEGARLPRAPCLYDARITFDMCTMLWSWEHLLSRKAEKCAPWVLHVRCDSSPQFGRDFLVTQADYVQYGRDAATTIISKRLMPIQCVGSRAGSEGHKLDKILCSLTLESEQVA